MMVVSAAWRCEVLMAGRMLRCSHWKEASCGDMVASFGRIIEVYANLNHEDCSAV
jgi:hypothetical protein